MTCTKWMNYIYLHSFILYFYWFLFLFLFFYCLFCFFIKFFRVLHLDSISAVGSIFVSTLFFYDIYRTVFQAKAEINFFSSSSQLNWDISNIVEIFQICFLIQTPWWNSETWKNISKNVKKIFPEYPSRYLLAQS